MHLTPTIYRTTLRQQVVREVAEGGGAGLKLARNLVLVRRSVRLAFVLRECTLGVMQCVRRAISYQPTLAPAVSHQPTFVGWRCLCPSLWTHSDYSCGLRVLLIHPLAFFVRSTYYRERRQDYNQTVRLESESGCWTQSKNTHTHTLKAHMQTRGNATHPRQFLT